MLIVRGLEKTFRLRDSEVRALDGVNFDVARGEFFVLLGPSGCGKTTMLRSIAGLERPDRGTISIDGEPVVSSGERRHVPPEHRPIAMVFQSYAVWPHMDVYENVAFPLREGVRRLPRDEQHARVSEVLDLLALSGLADRPVTTLSGGQQQRVALARALALRPKVLLMDEPLSNLDFKLQLRLRAQLKELMHRLDLTTVYVTHNQAEAMETGDRIAVMDHGRMVQIGTPREVYRHPLDEFVARFIGEMSLVPATLVEIADGFAMLQSAIGRIRALAPREGGLSAGARCLLGIRPEDMRLAEGGAAAGNTVEGEVTARQFVGEAIIYTVLAGSERLRVKLHHGVELGDGGKISLHLPPEHCSVVAPAVGGGEAYESEETLTGGAGGDAG